jgi:hypothetical protein
MSKKIKPQAPIGDTTVDATTAAQESPAAKVVMLVLGAKAPKHRAGHNSAAWSAILPCLPATFATLAALPETGACNATGKGGHLFVSYAIRRGWLAPQA